MNSKDVAAIIMFAALALMLNLSPFKIPAPYATFLIYQIWEIPIVVAFLLYGVKVGVSVAILNTLALLIIFTGQLPTGPLYNLAAVLSMLLGIYIVNKVAITYKEYSTEIAGYTMLAMLSIMAALIHNPQWLFPGVVFGILSIIAICEGQRKNKPSTQTTLHNPRDKQDAFWVTASTISGVFWRVIIMSIINLVFLPFPPPVGFNMPQGAVIAMLPLVGFFNATLALYTIPIGHTIARIVKPGLKTTG